MTISKEQKDYVKYNTGLYSVKFLAKKTGLKPYQVYYLQHVKTKITTTNSLQGFDYIPLKNVIDYLGITYSIFAKIQQNDLVDIIVVGKFKCILLEDLEKLEKLLGEYISYKEVKNIFKPLNFSYKQIFELLLKIEYLTFNAKTKRYKKSTVIELKKFFINSYSIQEFAQLTNYSYYSIYLFIKNKRIKTIKNKYVRSVRIPKEELQKFNVT